MDKSFVEIKLFQVKPDQTEQFEAMAERMSADQAKWDGCISLRYFKRFYTIDGIELGDPPRELTKVVKCVKYYPDGDYHFFVSKDWAFGLYGHPWRKELIVVGEGLIAAIEKKRVELGMILIP